MSETILKIEGMKCCKCKAAVETALSAVEGVTGVTVDMENHQAAVEGAADEGALAQAVRDAGFEVVE